MSDDEAEVQAIKAEALAEAAAVLPEGAEKAFLEKRSERIDPDN